MVKNALIRLFALGLLVGTLQAVGGVSPASAATYLGGGNGGGAGCSGWSAKGWTFYGNRGATGRESTGSDGVTSAYKRASKLKQACSGPGWSDVPKSLRDGCRKSTFIWIYIVNKGGNRFLYNAKSTVNGRDPFSAPLSTTKAGEIKKSLGGGGSTYYKNVKKEVEKAITSYKPSTNKTLTLICSYQSETKVDTPNCPKGIKAPKGTGKEAKVTVNKNNSGKKIPSSHNTSNTKRGEWCFGATLRNTQTRAGKVDAKTANNPYTWTSEVGNGGPTFGTDGKQKAKLNINNSDVAQKTSVFGKLLQDSLKAKKVPTPKQVNDAIAKDKSSGHAQVKVSETNQKALAQGGVMNVVERTINARLERTAPDERRYTYKPLVYQVNTKGKATRNSWSSSVNRTSAWTKIGNPKFNIVVSAQHPTAMTQFLSVHCNKEGYETAAGKANVQAINNDDNSKTLSGAARVNNVNPNNPTWGRVGSADGTGSKGFYDKECAFTGRVTNDSRDTDNAFDFFRDGQGGNHKVALDRYVPADVPNVVRGGDKPALTTIVSRWGQGTPLPNGLSEKGQFELLDRTGGKNFFSKEAVDAPVQRNWEVTPYQSRNLGIIEGEINDLIAEANWVSDKGKPQVFTVKWEYAPDVANTIPNAVTFRTGGAVDAQLGKVWVPIEGKVQYRNDKGVSNGDSAQVASNSGSGSKNTVDGNPNLNGVSVNGNNEWSSNPTDYSPFYATVRFLRAVSE